MPSGRTATWLLAVLAGSCGPSGYDVEVNVPGGAERARRVEICVLSSCDVVDAPGDAPPEPLRCVEERARAPAAALGNLEPGDWALYARAWDEDCRIFAAGCAAFEVEAGGSGTISVTTEETVLREPIAGSVGVEGRAWDVAISGSFALVAGMESGLHVVDLASPTAPLAVASLPGEHSASGIAVQDDLAFVQSEGGSVDVIDVTSPAAPVVVGSFVDLEADPINGGESLAVSGDYVVSTLGSLGLRILDVSDPEAPVEAGRLETPCCPEAVAMAGPLALVAAQEAGLLVVDVLSPTAPILRGELDTGDYVGDVVASGTRAFLAAGDQGLLVVDLTEPSAPVLAGALETGAFGEGVALSGSLVLLADGRGLTIADVTDLDHPVEVGVVHLPGTPMSVTVLGDHAVVAAQEGGVLTVDLSCFRTP